jgi:hypothetical protein
MSHDRAALVVDFRIVHFFFCSLISLANCRSENDLIACGSLRNRPRRSLYLLLDEDRTGDLPLGAVRQAGEYQVFTRYVGCKTAQSVEVRWAEISNHNLF